MLPSCPRDASIVTHSARSRHALWPHRLALGHTVLLSATPSCSRPHQLALVREVRMGSCATDPNPDPNPTWTLTLTLKMECFRQYIEYTPSWSNSVVCICATTGVRRFRGSRLHSTGGQIFKMQSSYNSTVAVEILTETAFICSFPSVYITGNNHSGCAMFIHPTRS